MFFLVLETLDNEEDQEKAKQLYDCHCVFIANYVRKFVKDPYLTEDIVQETFIRAIRRIDQFDDVVCCKARAFCKIVAKRLAIDHFRETKNFAHIDDDQFEQVQFSSSPSLTPADMLVNRESYERLLDCVCKLPEIYKSVFRLRYIFHYSDKEVAKMLDLTVNTVTVRCYRARKKMQSMLRGDDEQ